MKNLSEMNFDEKVDWVTGNLILSIGNGTFKSEIVVMIMALTQEAYDRGVIEGKKHENA